MRNRWLPCAVCALIAEIFILLGWLAPAHLRAVEPSVLQRAGHQTPGLVETGLAMAGQGNLGAASMLLRAAQQAQVPDRDPLAHAVNNLAAQHPESVATGAAASPRLQQCFPSARSSPDAASSPALADLLIDADNRDRALALLQSSRVPLVQALLQSRVLTNTAIFPPSSSEAGQAYDLSVCVCGLLAEEQKLTAGLNDALLALAAKANHGGDSRPIEDALINFMSLSQRLDWGQLSALVANVNDADTLRRLTAAARDAGPRLPVVFAAVELSGRPNEVCQYLTAFSQTGAADLQAALTSGAGGVTELLRVQQRLYVSGGRERLAASPAWSGLLHGGADFMIRSPRLALAVKYLFYFAGGFFLALSLHFALGAPDAGPELRPPGFHLARETIFALGFVFVALLLSEPFLAQDSQKLGFPIQLRLHTTGGGVPALIAGARPSAMNPVNLLTLLLFFVLQALLYVTCLVKLAEIRRVRASSRIRLRLLENEDHLFDAGLYLGFVGTIISLILVSLGVIQPSLMAAYSSTSFGIIFVSCFKIFHLRPARRQLLLEAESQAEPLAAERSPLSASAFAES